jgi:transcriptional regulator of nitric oxide reductase
MPGSDLNELARETSALAFRLIERIAATYRKVERSKRLADQVDLIAGAHNVVMTSQTKVMKNRATKSRRPTPHK